MCSKVLKKSTLDTKITALKFINLNQKLVLSNKKKFSWDIVEVRMEKRSDFKWIFNQCINFFNSGAKILLKISLKKWKRELGEF